MDHEDDREGVTRKKLTWRQISAWDRAKLLFSGIGLVGFVVFLAWSFVGAFITGDFATKLAILGFLLLVTTVVVWWNAPPSGSPRSGWRIYRAVAWLLTVATIGGAGAWVAYVRSLPDSGHTADFCSSHSCIPNFGNGHGSIVQCADGMWSHSGGLAGACSDHGGEG